MDNVFLPAIDPAELRRLDTICDLGVRFESASGVTISEKASRLDRSIWDLGRREAVHMIVFATK